MRRVLAAAIAVCLMFPALAVPTVAAPTIPDREPPVPLADRGSCATIQGSQGGPGGQTNSTPNISANRSGVKANIDPPLVQDGFVECIGNWELQTIGPSAYVSIQPRGATWGLAEGNTPDGQGLFLGVILCDRYFPPVTYCEAIGSHTLHFFAAVNGASVTTIYDLQDNVGTGSHEYAIYLNYDQRWHFSIDGKERMSVANSSLSWGGGLRMAGYGGMKWDGGDAWGNDSLHRVTITNAAYGLYGQGWQPNPFDVNVDCVWENDADGDECVVSSSNSLRLYE
jgi:hypothetical protein